MPEERLIIVEESWWSMILGWLYMLSAYALDFFYIAKAWSTLIENSLTLAYIIV